jgi:hypothetical protein
MTYCEFRLLFYVSGAVKFTAILLVALLVSGPTLLAQDATGTPTPDPLLSKATIENQKAQATYYKRQVRPRVWKQVQDMLPGVGASLAAVVALLSLQLNLGATLRNQQDTQFYEALKRFGAGRKLSLPTQAWTPSRREEELEKLASKHGYTKKRIASEIGVSITAVYQWSKGYINGQARDY